MALPAISRGYDPGLGSPGRQSRLECGLGVLSPNSEKHVFERPRLEGLRLSDHDPSALVEREAADSRPERRQRERAAAELVGNVEAGAGRSAHELRVRAQVLAHHRPVDDVASMEPAGGGSNGGPELDRPLRHRFVLDLVAADPLQRARDARPHPEVVVRGVGDRVGLHLGDIALADFELHGSEDARAERGSDELDGELAGCVLTVEDRVDLDHVQRVEQARLRDGLHHEMRLSIGEPSFDRRSDSRRLVGIDDVHVERDM